MRRHIRVLCYKCGEYGYLGHGWVESRYRFKYRPDTEFLGIEEKARKRRYGRPYSRYYKLYIRHYSHEKYKEQMEKYRSYKIKSRPNGQKRCYISPSILFCPYGEEAKRERGSAHLGQGVQNELLDYLAAYRHSTLEMNVYQGGLKRMYRRAPILTKLRQPS